MTVVYHCWDANERLLYVGQTYRLDQRMVEHERRSDWYQFVTSVTTEGPFYYREAFDREWEILRSTPGYFNAVRQRPGIVHGAPADLMAEYLTAVTT